MKSHPFRIQSHPSIQAVILSVYACFAIFGLALHHWSGRHWHADHGHAHLAGQGEDCHIAVAVCTRASTAEQRCCHAPEGHGTQQRSTQHRDGQQRDTQGHRSSIGTEPSACEGCQQWASIVQASSSLASVESIHIDCRVEWTAECARSLGGVFGVDWNSRAPPIAVS